MAEKGKKGSGDICVLQVEIKVPVIAQLVAIASAGYL